MTISLFLHTLIVKYLPLVKIKAWEMRFIYFLKSNYSITANYSFFLYFYKFNDDS